MSAPSKRFVPVTIFGEIDPFASDRLGVSIYLHIKVANTVGAERVLSLLSSLTAQIGIPVNMGDCKQGLSKNNPSKKQQFDKKWSTKGKVWRMCATSTRQRPVWLGTQHEGGGLAEFGSLKPGAELADVTSAGLIESESCATQYGRGQFDREHRVKGRGLLNLGFWKPELANWTSAGGVVMLVENNR